MASYYMLTTLAFTGLNIILLLISIGGVAAGSILMTFGLHYRQIVGNIPSVAPIALLTVAIIISVLCVLGALGTFFENRNYLLMYFVLMTLTFMSLMVGVIVVFINHRSLERSLVAQLRKSMNDTLISPRSNESIAVWDQLQGEHKCCGFDGYRDWQGKYGNNLIPSSCIALNLTILNQLPDALKVPYYLQGCRVPVHNNFSNVLMKLGITAISMATVQVFCIVASLANYCYVKTAEGYF